MSVIRSSLWFTFGTLLSRLSGLIRDVVLAGVFGASSAMESFLIANRIPNLFRDMLAEGALGSSFTKVYTSLSVEDESRAHILFCDAIRFGVLLLLGISVLGFFAAGPLVEAFTALNAGRPDSFGRETTVLTQVMFPFLGFAVLAALSAGVLQQQSKFFLTSWASSFLNLGYIFGALVLSLAFTRWLPLSFTERYCDPAILGLAVGVVLGGAMHFAIQFYVIIKSMHRRWQNSSEVFSADLRHVFLLMTPAAIASSAGAINLFVNTNFASSLGTGAVTWLNYSFRLLQLPIGIFAVSVGSVVLPSLTRAITKAGRKVNEEASQQLQNACEAILWIMVACLVFLVVNCSEAVSLLFYHGAYTKIDAEQTSAALFAYSFGVIGYGLIKVLTSYYYAVERTAFALKVSLCTVLINLVANYFFTKMFGHVGLAWTASLTLSLNAFLLILGTMQDSVHWNHKILLRSITILGLVSVVSIVVQDQARDAMLLHWNESILITSKLKALGSLSVNGLLLAAVFLVGASIRMKLSPFGVLSLLRPKRG